MELNKIYKFIDQKYSPIVGYLNIFPFQELKDLLKAINNKSGIMNDFFGFEFEENSTLTFYDFTSDVEKKINISVQEFIEFLEPITRKYLIQNPSDILILENIIREIHEL